MDMVEELADLLGAHVFSTALEAGATSSAKHHIAKVRRNFMILCTVCGGGRSVRQ